MSKTVVGLFESAGAARMVVDGLIAAGCRREDIGLVAKNDRTTQAGIGAALGDLGRVLAGLGALAIPGFGPVIAAGPIAAGLAGAAGVGGLIGGLVGLGIAEAEAQAYAEGVRRGNTLVIAKIADVAVGTVIEVMNRHHPIDGPATVRSASTAMRLHQERVEVERMPADRPIGDADRAFQERSVERRDDDAVVGKKARVVEEVRVDRR